MVITAVVSLLALVAFAVALGLGWFGPDVGAGANFCEAARDGLIKQPANTWSNLGFVIAGLAAALYLDRHWSELAYPTLLAPFPVLMALLGPGSMAMHATQSSLGGRFDVGSMYLFAGYAAAYGLTRLLGRGLFTLSILFVVLVVGAEVLGASDIPAPLVDTAGNLAFAVLLLVAVLVEVFIQRRPTHPASWRWALMAVGAMALAFLIWSLSHSGGPLCDPQSLLQGHAVWHVLCAVAAYSLFRFYASERPAA
ncbi:hypothetical protein AZH51_05465 [Branchiibius sp. NY16-3462-2]|nr:hypothetical protein AZH51_05465 [Branchiibius sp. NY16-3462-2]